MLAPYETAKIGELRAVAYKIVVEPEPAPERVIALVRDRPDVFRIGRVVSIGSEANEKIPELAVGDRVLYSQSVACTTAVKDRHIVHHEHVLCIVEGGSVAELDPNILERAG
jgi:co-chaperonin GroES (HSP10)